jgi:hypothetical protein
MLPLPVGFSGGTLRFFAPPHSIYLQLVNAGAGTMNYYITLQYFGSLA